RAVAPRIEPLLAAALGIDEALLLVEAQRARRDGEFPGQIANGEDVAAACVSGFETGDQVGDAIIRAFQFGHAISPETEVCIHLVYVNVKTKGEKFHAAAGSAAARRLIH